MITKCPICSSGLMLIDDHAIKFNEDFFSYKDFVMCSKKPFDHFMKDNYIMISDSRYYVSFSKGKVRASKLVKVPTIKFEHIDFEVEDCEVSEELIKLIFNKISNFEKLKVFA
jgi:hypothetical protein